jgi:hypothetical protein
LLVQRITLTVVLVSVEAMVVGSPALIWQVKLVAAAWAGAGSNASAPEDSPVMAAMVEQARPVKGNFAIGDYIS